EDQDQGNSDKGSDIRNDFLKKEIESKTFKSEEESIKKIIDNLDNSSNFRTLIIEGIENEYQNVSLIDYKTILKSRAGKSIDIKLAEYNKFRKNENSIVDYMIKEF